MKSEKKASYAFAMSILECLFSFNTVLVFVEWTHCEADTQYSDRYLSICAAASPLHYLLPPQPLLCTLCLTDNKYQWH